MNLDNLNRRDSNRVHFLFLELNKGLSSLHSSWGEGYHYYNEVNVPLYDTMEYKRIDSPFAKKSVLIDRTFNR